MRKDGQECDTLFDASHFGAATRVPITHFAPRLLIRRSCCSARAAGGARVDQASVAQQLLIWDKVLGLDRADPLAGFAAITSNLVGRFFSLNKVMKT
jgi:hypothetical protein